MIIRSLRDTLKENGVEEIFEIKGGAMRIHPEKIRCDLFRFCNGDMSAMNAYRGEYMNGYPWASMTAGVFHSISRPPAAETDSGGGRSVAWDGKTLPIPKDFWGRERSYWTFVGQPVIT